MFQIRLSAAESLSDLRWNVGLYKANGPLTCLSFDKPQNFLSSHLKSTNMHLNVKFNSLLTTVALFSQSAVAHYRFPSLIVDGTPTPEFKYVRFNTNNINPLLDLNSIDLRCNEGGLASGPQTETATVQAGSTVPYKPPPSEYPHASANCPAGRFHSE
jgi:hypothetical protein